MYMLIVVSMALKRAAAALLLLVAPGWRVQASAMDLRVISQMESTIYLELRVSSSNHHGGDQAEEWCGRPTHVDVMSKEKKKHPFLWGSWSLERWTFFVDSGFIFAQSQSACLAVQARTIQ